MARQSVKLEDNFVDLAYKLGDIEGLDSKRSQTIYSIYN
jgi:hypothetical protein